VKCNLCHRYVPDDDCLFSNMGIVCRACADACERTGRLPKPSDYEPPAPGAFRITRRSRSGERTRMSRVILWAATTAAIAGNVLLVHRIRAAFLVWTAANLVFLTRNLRLREWAQAALWATYTALAVWGWCHWGK